MVIYLIVSYSSPTDKVKLINERNVPAVKGIY